MGVLINSNKNAPNITGIESKNENFAASSDFKPVNSPAEIVIPLLETPGKRARSWKNPTKREFFQLSSEKTLENLVNNKIIPVNINAKPKKRSDEKELSILDSKKQPNIAAGIVAIIRYIHIFL
jgi:hypothetical protein